MTDRKSTAERGYGAAHQAERERWRPIVESGQARCAERVCLEPSRWLDPMAEWHLAHELGQEGYLGPAHPRCNTAEANRRAAKTRRQAEQAASSQWWRP